MDSELSFRREVGRIYPMGPPVLSPIVKVPSWRLLPPTQEAPGIGPSHGELSPLLWSIWLTSLREHVVFVLSFHRALLVGGGMTVTLCFRSGPAG